VDLDANKNLQTQLKIQSFPTLLFFKNGVPINFGGSRSKQFMTSWLAKKIQEPIVTIPQSRLPSLETDGNVNIVFYGDAESPQYNTILSLAKNDDYNSMLFEM
jgi:protein disulfide-isomerase A1